MRLTSRMSTHCISLYICIWLEALTNGEGIKYLEPMKHSGLSRWSISHTWPYSGLLGKICPFMSSIATVALSFNFMELYHKANNKFWNALKFCFFFSFPVFYSLWVMCTWLKEIEFCLQNQWVFSTKILRGMFIVWKENNPQAPPIYSLYFLMSLCLIELSERTCLYWNLISRIKTVHGIDHKESHHMWSFLTGFVICQ